MSEVLTRGAMLLLQLMQNKREGQNGMRGIGIALISVVSAVLILLCGIIYILTSPIEFVGELGKFQTEYAWLVAPKDSVTEGEALSSEEIAILVSDITDPDRRAVVETALSLVGRVPYFWGGKSGPGWNEEWNTLKRVSAPGSSTSGTLQPYGLDCTGFVHWVYWTALGRDSLRPAAANSLWYGTDPIPEEELLPGDIVYKDPPTVPVNHVGVYLGKGTDGKKIYIHCSFSGGGVVMNSYSGFRYWRRAPVLEHTRME